MNPLTALIEGLEAALASGDGAVVGRLLHANPPLWDVREGHGTEWDRYANLLVRLTERDLDGTAPHVRHAIRNLLWIPDDPGLARLERLLPAMDRFVARDAQQLLRFIDEITGRSEPAVSAALSAWLDGIDRHRNVSTDTADAARLVYANDVSRDWEAMWPTLITHLSGPTGMVRAYAARLLGAWHREHRLIPTLPQVMDHITELDLARPGVAGPFLAAFYSDGRLDDLQARCGKDLNEWVLQLLEHRRGPEPNLLPCCNGVDFFAHEMLSTEPALLRLVRAGHIGIAAEAAFDFGVDLCRLLGRMADERMPIARDVAAHMLLYYGDLPVAAEKSGAVQRLTPLPGAERLLLPPTSREPDVATMLVVLPPTGTVLLAKDAIWAAIDSAIGPGRRGAILSERRSQWLGGTTTVTCQNGTTIHLVGPGAEAGWHRAIMLTQLPVSMWACSEPTPVSSSVS